MALFCETCNVGVSSEITMRDHIKGRRHLQAVAAAERRRTQARCSLYCRDFSPTTTEAILRQYFSQFGAISRVMLATEKGRYCIVHFDNESAVQKALAHPDHQLAGHRLTVRPRRPITASAGHSHLSEVRSNLQKAKAAVSEQAEAQKKAEHEHLMQILLQADSVVEQMQLLYNSVRLSDEDLKNRHELCRYLHTCLLPFFPTCTIHLFGSSINGYGMKGCDMDVFLDFHDDEISLEEEEDLRKKLKPVVLPFVGDIKSIPTTSGPLLPSHLRNMPLVDRVRLLSRVLTYHAQCCADVSTIPSTRCPITRFVHIQTGIKCDMSINNRLALKNTQLLRLCSQDHRVQLLMCAVRYWAKWRQVAGNVGSGPRLSNYCLTLLVMFYLARTDPPVLPKVHDLSEMAAPEEVCFIESWNCSIPSWLPPSPNTQTADQLLQGFFEFYSHIDFSSSVILTRTASTILLQQFLAERDLNPAIKDFKIKAMAVQDPFVLSHNIALNVNGRTKDLLTTEIGMASSKTAGWSSSDHWKNVVSSSFAGWGLPCLFSSLGCQMYSHDLALSTPLTGTTKPKELTCSLSLDLSVVSHDVLSSLHAGGDYRRAWYKCVQKLLFQTLRDVFLFTLHKENGDVIGDDWGSSDEEWNSQSSSELIFSEKDLSEPGDDEPKVQGQGCRERASPENVPFSDSKSPQALSSADVSFPCSAHTLWTPGSTFPVVTSRPPHSVAIKSRNSPKHKIKRQTSDSGSAFAGKKRVRNEIRHHRSGSHRNMESSISNGHKTCGGIFPERAFSPSYLSILEPAGSQQSLMSSANSSQALSSLTIPEKFNLESVSTAGESCQEIALQNILPDEVRSGDFSSVPPSEVSHGFASPPVSSDGFCPVNSKLTASCGSPEQSPQKQNVPVEKVTLYSASKGEKPPWSGPSSDSRAESVSMDWELHSSSQDIPQRTCESACTRMPPDGRENTFPASPLVTAGTSGTSKALFIYPLQDFPCSSSRAASHNDYGSCDSTELDLAKHKASPPLVLVCEGCCRTWYGRKVLRAQALASGYVDGFDLEKYISQQIYLRDSGSSLEPIKFKCELSMCPSPDKTEAEVNFESCTPLKEFSVFVTFFKSFFPKVVSRHLTSVSHTTP